MKYLEIQKKIVEKMESRFWTKTNEAILPFCMGVVSTLAILQFLLFVNYRSTSEEHLKINSDEKAHFLAHPTVPGALSTTNLTSQEVIGITRSHAIRPSYKICGTSIVNEFKRSEILASAEKTWNFFVDIHSEVRSIHRLFSS